MTSRVPIGQRLLEAGLIDGLQLKSALAYHSSGAVDSGMPSSAQIRDRAGILGGTREAARRAVHRDR